MKITVWGINYSPEVIGIAPYNTELCTYLAERGHTVSMVTTFAYYPAWRKIPTEQYISYRTDSLEDVTVHRCWHYVPSKVTTVRRMIHELSFVFSSLLRLITLPRPEVLVVISPPLLLGCAAWLVSLFKKCPFIFHVQDMQPDAAAGLGMVQSSLFIRLLYAIEGFAYRKSARVSGISRGMLAAFSQKGVPASKLLYFPNGVHIPTAFPQPGLFRKQHGLAATDFLLVYSGNMGVKQGLQVLVQAAALISNPRFKLVLCGEGNQREALSQMISQSRLRNVLLLPVQAERHYRELLVDANLCVITQLTRSGSFFFPSKLLITLAFSKPVLTVADCESELARASSIGQFGINSPPGNPELLAQTIEDLMGKPELLTRFGASGHAFVQQFSFDKIFHDLEREFISLGS